MTYIVLNRSQKPVSFDQSPVPLEFDGGALPAPDVPHDDGVIRAARKQHPLHGVPAQSRDVTWSGKSFKRNLKNKTRDMEFCWTLHGFFTCVSFEGGNQAAAVLLQLQDGHLSRLVSHKRMTGLHIKPGSVKDSACRTHYLQSKLQNYKFHNVFLQVCSFSFATLIKFPN